MTRKRAVLTILFAGVLLGLCSAAYANVVAAPTVSLDVTVSAVAAIAVSGEVTVVFTVGGSPAAGAFPVIDGSTNTATYLQYTSVVPAAETRTIAVSAGAPLPDGLILNVRAGTPTGNGGVGTPVPGGVNIGSTYVADAPLTIVTGITSCATGITATQGAPVLYSLTLDEDTFTSLDTDAVPTITITYTLVGS